MLSKSLVLSCPESLSLRFAASISRWELSVDMGDTEFSK